MMSIPATMPPTGWIASFVMCGRALPTTIEALDGVQDPRNLGACLRSAGAAGVQAVLLPKRNSAPVNAAALKTAAGVAENLFIVSVTNLARRLDWLKDQGAWLTGAAGEADRTCFEADFTSDTVLVKEIVIASPAITYELAGSAGDNIRAIQKNAEAYTGGSSGGGSSGSSSSGTEC